MILTSITLVGYPIVIQFKRGGLWWLFAIPGLVVLLVNVLANHIELPIIFARPRKGEWTISKRVKRMQSDPQELRSRRDLASLVQVFLDACEPDGKH